MWGPDPYEFRPERWLDMNKKPDLPFGVYANLYVFYFHILRLYRELRSLNIALHFLEVPGVALDGDSRKPPDFTSECFAKQIRSN